MEGCTIPISPINSIQSLSPLQVNLGQSLRDGQPAIITTQTHKGERPRGGKCSEGKEEGLMKRRRRQSAFLTLPRDRMVSDISSHVCMMLPTFTHSHPAISPEVNVDFTTLLLK